MGTRDSGIHCRASGVPSEKRIFPVSASQPEAPHGGHGSPGECSGVAEPGPCVPEAMAAVTGAAGVGGSKPVVSATPARLSQDRAPRPTGIVLKQPHAAPGGFSDANAGDVEFEVLPGTKLPAVFSDDSVLTDGQSVAADAIAESFLDQVATAGDPSSQTGLSPTTQGPGDSWSSASFFANELYRALFGESAYNQRLIQSALEAMAEQQ
jgi:hypothetical protein